MPQLSLYLDEKTLKKIESAAKKEKVSLSQWVKHRIQNSLETNWPEDYFRLYGSIQDDSFQAPNHLEPRNDSPREQF